MFWAFAAAIAVALVLLASISSTLEKIASKLDDLMEECESINSNTRQIESELSRIGEEVKKIEDNVNSIDTRLISVEGGINSIDEQMHDLILLQIDHTSDSEPSALEDSGEISAPKKRYP